MGPFFIASRSWIQEPVSLTPLHFQRPKSQETYIAAFKPAVNWDERIRWLTRPDETITTNNTIIIVYKNHRVSANLSLSEHWVLVFEFSFWALLLSQGQTQRQVSDQVPQTKEERGVIGPGRQTGLRLGRLGISQIRPTTAKHITSRCTTYYEVTQDRKLETTWLPHLADPSQSQPSLTSYPAALHIHYNYYISTHWKNSTQKHHNTQQILAWTQERRSQETQPLDRTRTYNS